MSETCADRIIGQDVEFSIGSDLVAHAESIEITRETQMIDMTGLYDDDECYQPGTRGATASVESMWVPTDDAREALDTAFDAKSPITITWAHKDGAGGSGTAYVSSDSFSWARNGRVVNNIEFRFTGAITRTNES